jgi:hypothetical protein
MRGLPPNVAGTYKYKEQMLSCQLIYLLRLKEMPREERV